MKKRVFITKYALTTGITDAMMQVSDDGKFCHGTTPGIYFTPTYFDNEFHLTRAEAVKQAEKMRDRKISNLTKQIEKLQALHF